MGIRDHTVSLFKPKPDEMKCHMAKIKGKTYLSQFKRKGDVSCYGEGEGLTGSAQQSVKHGGLVFSA